MRPRTLFVLGVVLLGFFASVGAASMIRAADPDVPTSLAVPAGRLGDRVLYEGSWVDEGVDEGEPWKEGRATRDEYAVVRTEQALDRSGRMQPAVLVVQFRLAQEERQPNQTARWVSLASRQWIRQDAEYNGTDPYYRFPFRRAVTAFGPYVDCVCGGQPSGMVRFQGQTLEMGGALTDMRYAEKIQEGLGRGGYVVTRLDYEQRIDAAAWVDGNLSFAVHERIDYWTRVDNERRSGPGDERWMEEWRDWFSAGSPYPVFREYGFVYEWHPDGGLPSTETYRETQRLVHYQPGWDPIPWAPIVDPALPAPPVPERGALSDRVGFPPDGAVSRLPYRLSTAVASVESDPTLGRFLAWKTANPSYVLVGAQLRRGADNDGYCLPPSHKADIHGWYLLYAVPDGTQFQMSKGFLVSSVQPSNSAPPVNRDVSPASFNPTAPPRIEATLLREGFVSLGYAERLWEAYAPPDQAARGPNYVNWGVQWVKTGINQDCVTSINTYPHEHVIMVSSVNGGLRLLTLGREEVDSVRVFGVSAHPGSLNITLLTLNATSGLLASGRTRSETHGYLLFGRVPTLGKGAQGADVVPVPAPAKEHAAPVLAAVAAASTSLLVAVILTYFYPALKFGATQLFFTPGYAKLRRESLLEHGTREALLTLIQNEPGISPPELQGRLGAGWSTIVYHLTVLERSALVSSLLDGRHKRFFPTDAVDFGKRGQLAALRNDRTRQVFEIIRDSPGVHQKELGRRVGITPASILWHVRRLEHVGLVSRGRRGRQIEYHASAAPPDLGGSWKGMT